MGRATKKIEMQVSNISYLKEVFETERGIDCLYDLCKKFHFFHTSYNGDTNDTIFREGERNVVNYLVLLLKQSPAKILEEFHRRQQEEMEYEE